MEFLTYQGRDGNKALFKSDGGQKYAVQILGTPGVNGPAMATFAVHSSKWDLPVEPRRLHFENRTGSLNPDPNSVIESMFERLEACPQAIFKGSAEELELCKI